MVLTVVFSVAAGLGVPAHVLGSSALFYAVIVSLVAPGYILGIGIGLMFHFFGWDTDWNTSALGAQLSWTLPFGLLIIFAVFGRFNPAFEEAARDLGATPAADACGWWWCRSSLPGIIAVALFGFTLSYDEFARTLQTIGSQQHHADRDLEHDAERYFAVDIRARHADHRAFVFRHRHLDRLDCADPAAAVGFGDEALTVTGPRMDNASELSPIATVQKGARGVGWKSRNAIRTAR